MTAAAGRVLAAAVTSAVDVPAVPRCMMDGYAVRAADSGPRRLVGAAYPGRPFSGVVHDGECVRVTTGAALPTGAEAVLMAELADAAGDTITARSAVPAGKHVGRVGEDVAAGREVLPAGRVLRPQDVGLLASIGVSRVDVVRRPRVAVLATGDELLPPGSTPDGSRIVDSNSPMLAALVARDGGDCEPTRYLPDDFDTTHAALRDATADVILVTGGTSVGTEDHAPRALADVGELAVHGIGVKPAGPTGVGFVGGRAVFLLPGNPVSCLCAYDLFAGRAVRRLGGRPVALPYRSAVLPLAAAVASAVGRVDYVRVRVEGGGAVPLGGGASNLSGAVVADGFALVPAAREEMAAGEAVEVWFYDGP
ncbi:Molybdopterin molybdenumtransferase [Urbifossiella limnaea]|uniref:Molybdopterin molybdenumtransferase n=1 Tax=Urbifossiella limnaea TaxID=2528023 RepID=A0A517XYB4_9BACT|nr:Molybdopterin molybdenumtransferase [Urbifossiella limnaea]